VSCSAAEEVHVPGSKQNDLRCLPWHQALRFSGNLNTRVYQTLHGDGSKPWYLVNPKIAGKWMFIPLKMVLIGIDPYPHQVEGLFVRGSGELSSLTRLIGPLRTFKDQGGG